VKPNQWILGAALLAGLGAVALAVSERSAPPPAVRAPEQRPTLALLTSLPLVFGERFALGGGGSAALTRLEQRYKVVPIGVADAASLAGQQMLLMAHARAQPAGALVDLDRWVRGGGRLVLLADPKLDWESARPLGDKLRPPPAFADTGLLAHWGVELLADGPSELPVATASPGRLASKSCELANGGFIARCTIGKGRAIIIADADFLNGEPTNLDLLIDELARLERR
jgi:hypothetical protein